MAMLHIALLGGFRVAQRDGGQVTLSSRKGALLLARLAVPPGMPRSREHLQDLLWAESDQTRAQGNLRYLLHKLRATLPTACADALVSERNYLCLDADRVMVDADQFERCLREGTETALAEACALYQGDLLADLAVRETGFEDWLLPERERLRELARDAFWHHFQAAVRRRDIAAATHTARRYIDLDPYCDRLHGALIRLHLALGERSLAAQRYAHFKAVLARDLQIEPGSEITAMVRQAISDTGREHVPVRFDSVWVLGGAAPAKSGDEAGAQPGPDRASLAVLPFRCLSDDPETQAFAESVTEKVTTDLSRFRSLAVVDCGECGARRDAVGIARERGARYVLQGAIQGSRNRLWVSGKLIDAATGSVVWAERQHHSAHDLFDLQDLVTTSLVSRVTPRITAAEADRVRRLRPDQCAPNDLALRAYDRALSAYRDHSEIAYRDAVALARQAIALASDCGGAYAAIAEAQILAAEFAWTPVDGDALTRAEEAAERLHDRDPGDHAAYFFLGRVAFMRRQHSVAHAYLQKAADLNPNDTQVLCHLAWLEGSSGLPDAARDRAELALRLNPHDAATQQAAHWSLAQAAFVTGDYRAGVDFARLSHLDMPHHTADLGMLAACLAEARELVDAHAVMEKIKRRGRSYLADRLRGHSLFKHKADHNRYIGALRRAAAGLQ